MEEIHSVCCKIEAKGSARPNLDPQCVENGPLIEDIGAGWEDENRVNGFQPKWEAKQQPNSNPKYVPK